MTQNSVPTQREHTAVEGKWARHWIDAGVFCWDRNAPREKTFIIDTPPPTVSGSLHIGHVFSYTQQDTIARYQRLIGKNVCYPIGWDDNGLPTERRVEIVFGIRCDPRLPYDPNWKPRRLDDPKQKPVYISRPNFIEACAALTAEDEKVYEALYTMLGISYDWTLQYATIDDHCRRTAQLAFLRMLNRSEVYQTVAPTMWDVTFHTAVAQAEIEDREVNGTFYDFKFDIDDGSSVTIASTRPELLPACVALVAHPDDTRYQHLFGHSAITPVFRSPVPIVPATHVEMDKGTGIMMICTFGDGADVTWWKTTSGIAVKSILDPNGRLKPIRFGEDPFVSLDPDKANERYATLVGQTVNEAKKRIAAMLAEDGALLREQPVKQAVKYYEKGDKPIEFITSRQWFVKLLEHREDFLEMGRRIQWHPPHMRVRYEHWVNGLNQDWCISRQRYFGVPFPVWYRISDEGEILHDQIIRPDEKTLPVDPLAQAPPGYDESKRNQPGGFAGDPDVMDTWATSSLSPQITSRWIDDPERHRLLFPTDMRPQSHEIIRTWAFYTIVQSWMHEREIPWKHAMISGWIVDPDRKKMSKSKGNVVTPQALIEEHSADAVRYWASKARLGVDTAYDPALFRIGRRLATKILNAGRFVAQHFERTAAGTLAETTPITVEVDQVFLSQLAMVVKNASESFESFEYASALQISEQAFWDFCDNYLELVKVRAYATEETAETMSGRATLARTLRVFLRLLAPVVPFMTEEVWSWTFGAADGRSVHLQRWPSVEEVTAGFEAQNAYPYHVLTEVIAKVRGAKTAAQKSLRAPVSKLDMTLPVGTESFVRGAESDIRHAFNMSPDAVIESREGGLPSGERALVTIDLR
ncbi:MAG: valine--tRNA ligase [Thermoanaerobaculia bacterium]